MKSYFIVILATLVLFGCATNYHKLNCVDLASSAGHAYEHIIGQPAVVCIGRVSKDSKTRHAQAMGIGGNWLRIFDGYLDTDAPKELGEVYQCEPVRDFDNTRWNVKR